MSGEKGVVFPQVDGRRSTSATGRVVLAEAARGLDATLADRIAAEPDWRKGYHRHFHDLLVASVSTPEAALAVARDGLGALHRRFVVSEDGAESPLREAVRRSPSAPYGSVVVEGTGERERELSVPLHGRRLRGDELHHQLDDWVARGIVEPSHAEAVRLVAANPQWLDLSDVEVALLGAGAEMAPLRSLLRWGATVRAVDVPRAGVWQRILTAAHEGAGRVVVPVRGGAEAVDGDLSECAGADLAADPAAVRAWLAEAERRLVVGNYVYADGGRFPPLAMAVDAVTEALVESGPDTAVAVLATPTDVFAVPPEAVEQARARYRSRGWRALAQAPAQGLTGQRLFRASYRTTVTVPDGRALGVADCLVVQQGPNYALAKALQRWRSVAAHADGTVVSANVAPPTRTRSVLKNRVLAAAYSGARRFGVEVFAPATSSTLMAALLVHDLRRPPRDLAHPHDLYMLGANHGGLWRLPYEPRSVLGLAVVLGLVDRR